MWNFSIQVIKLCMCMSLCMGIPDSIEIATTAQVDEATIVKIKATIASPSQSSFTTQR